MRTKGLNEFIESVLCDREMQLRLAAIKDRNDFVNSVVAAGAENGYNLEPNEIKHVMQENRRLWLERWI